MAFWAKPGVKCVCVDAASERFARLFTWSGHADDFQLLNGATYTISEVLVHPLCDLVCIKLVELSDRGYADFGYALDRFRPLITCTQEDDLAIFRPLLIPDEVDA